jgi:hypothetical protein
MGKNQDLDQGYGSGMNIPDHISESKQFFGLKILIFFDADPDPGVRIFLTLDPGSGINIPDPQHCNFLNSKEFSWYFSSLVKITLIFFSIWKMWTMDIYIWGQALLNGSW